ncbi:UDP-glucuronate 4-epimerase [Azomonas agilis]|uniref:UDP-glucuronate 4-epimerase n=2 Tax=Azomonas agilis TaxID=116849 RepID=A0A562J0P5_9GAMM|nr:UDP-glucuronate 4-epimerase [Azomonas agilis]
MHTCISLLQRGDMVVGIDNLNDYYDVNLKHSRLDVIKQHRNFKNFHFSKIDIADRKAIQELFLKEKFDCVLNLAAQAGVRYSIKNPYSYIDSNINGFLNILEGCRTHKIKNLVYASSSSVYGSNTKTPFSEEDNVDHPISLYAATKKSNELMAHTYSHLYDIPTTGLRFFTVYGPWGRPDMALFLFTKAILDGKPINVYNNGEMQRDFTYIDDIVDGIIYCIDNPAKPTPSFTPKNPLPHISNVPFQVLNIGNNSPINLLEFIKKIEENLNCKANKIFMPLQDGDVLETFADINQLHKLSGYKPKTNINIGIKKFIEWYRNYYGINS